MKISDALLYTIYKNNKKMTSYDLLNYIKRLEQYDVIEINKDNLSFSLTDSCLSRLIHIGLIKL